MKTFKIAISVYFIILIITLFFPTSSEYSSLLWKLTIAQIYAIPAFLITLIVFIVFKSNKSSAESKE